MTDHPTCAQLENEGDNDDLQHTMAEYAAWIDYLVHYEGHDGPRRIRFINGNRMADGRTEVDLNKPADQPLIKEGEHYEVIGSVLDGTDPSTVHEAVLAVAGCSPSVLGEAYNGVATGYLCVGGDGMPDDQDSGASAESEYPMLLPLSSDFAEMRKGWIEEGNAKAHDWEQRWIRFAVGNENAFLAIAEAFALYEAVYLEARRSLDEAVKALIARFEAKVATSPAEAPADGPNWFAALIAGAGVVSVTIVTGGATLPWLAAAGAIGTATAALQEQAGKSPTRYEAADPGRWRDLLHGFCEEITRQLEQFAGEIDSIRQNLVSRIAGIRNGHSLAPPAPDESIKDIPPHGRNIVPDQLGNGVGRWLDPKVDALAANSREYQAGIHAIGGADWGSSSRFPAVPLAGHNFGDRVVSLGQEAVDKHNTMVDYLRQHGEALRYVADTAQASEDNAVGVINNLLKSVESVQPM